MYELFLNKQNIYHPDFLGGCLESDQFLQWDPIRKKKPQNFPHIFWGISALGMSYSLKNMKIIVKSHQIMKSKKNAYLLVWLRDNIKKDF